LYLNHKNKRKLKSHIIVDGKSLCRMEHCTDLKYWNVSDYATGTGICQVCIFNKENPMILQHKDQKRASRQKRVRKSRRGNVKKEQLIEMPKLRISPKEFDKKSFYTSPEWREVRYWIFERDGRKCACCYSTKSTFHIDHIKPISIYPELRLECSNLQVLCEDCNMGKSNKFETDWRTK
jgi:5-methylcytosine-specific restriction endonuclease McrA